MSARFLIGDSIELIKSIKTSGTVTPSSRVLIRRMLAPVDFGAARCIVELGPGNGCITRELLGRMGGDAKLICLEVNEGFAARLGLLMDDPRLRVYAGCASGLRDILACEGVDCADYVVSSLPLALLDGDIADDILRAVRENLCPQGRFVQYQYSLAHYGDMKALFSKVRLQFTMRNMPPAFVYECSP